MSLPLSLYIHLPWCVKKCPYCDFNSHLKPSIIPEAEYLTALLIDLDHDLKLISDRQLSSIFFGGGTPSLFSASFITELLAQIAHKITFAPDIEISLEANPNSAEYKKFAAFRAAGVTRISLGAQSFQQDKLKILGRAHNTHDIYNALEAIKTSGFNNFNIDLMHGLPQQTVADALFDLTEGLKFAPPHLSWYQLTIEPQTVFERHPPALPDEHVLEQVFTTGSQLLAQHQYINYEISAFGQPNFFCRHNLNYWQYGDYLAIGAGAHSKITLTDGTIIRREKHRNPSKYLNCGNSFIAEQKTVTPAEVTFEFMLNNLRLANGFNIAEFEQYTGLNFNTIKPQINNLVGRELLQLNNQQVTTSALGKRFLNEVMQSFLG